MEEDVIVNSSIVLLDNEQSQKEEKKRLKKDVEYKIVKCKLKSILKNSYWLDDIKKTVKIINMIKMEAYFFFYQYILYLLQNKKKLHLEKILFQDMFYLY